MISFKTVIPQNETENYNFSLFEIISKNKKNTKYLFKVLRN